MLDSLLDWVNANPHWAGLVVFAVCLLESLAVVGVLVPGMVFLFSVGALAGHGSLSFYQLCLFGITGAIIGDGLSFLLGYHYRDKLHQWRWFERHKNLVHHGETFFLRYGTASIVIGRFFGPIRAFVPLVAGMLSMRPQTFFAANVFSAILWAPAVLLPGVVAGAALSVSLTHPYQLLSQVLIFLSSLWIFFHSIKDKTTAHKRLIGISLALALMALTIIWFMLSQRMQEIHDVFIRVWYVVRQSDLP